MSFQQGLSGLDAASVALDVIGNNVANSSTVGFKGATANFADVYAASLGIVGASQIGIGVGISAIQQQFTQGNLTTTNNPLDLAINGGGFFRMSQGGAVSYTRNGQFHIDNEGYIINDQTLRLTGYPVTTSGQISPSNPVELQLSASQIPPRATSDPLSGDLTAVLNLDSRDSVPALSPFDYANPATYNFSTALTVFDTLGVVHNLATYYVLNAPSAPAGGEWTVHATLDGADPQLVAGGNLVFDTSGTLSPASALHTLPTWNLSSGAASPWSPGTMNFTGTTQYGSDSSVDSLTQGGFASGSLVGVGVNNDGIVQGRYSNGQTRNMGQVVLASFTNPNGLQRMGENNWIPTGDSGPALLGAANTGTLGGISAGTIEESNVELSEELVDLISAQRMFQANAQSISAADTLTQTLLNMG